GEQYSLVVGSAVCTLRLRGRESPHRAGCSHVPQRVPSVVGEIDPSGDQQVSAPAAVAVVIDYRTTCLVGFIGEDFDPQPRRQRLPVERPAGCQDLCERHVGGRPLASKRQWLLGTDRESGIPVRSHRNGRRSNEAGNDLTTHPYINLGPGRPTSIT